MKPAEIISLAAAFIALISCIASWASSALSLKNVKNQNSQTRVNHFNDLVAKTVDIATNDMKSINHKMESFYNWLVIRTTKNLAVEELIVADQGVKLEVKSGWININNYIFLLDNLSMEISKNKKYQLNYICAICHVKSLNYNFNLIHHVGNKQLEKLEQNYLFSQNNDLSYAPNPMATPLISEMNWFIEMLGFSYQYCEIKNNTFSRYYLVNIYVSHCALCFYSKVKKMNYKKNQKILTSKNMS